MKINFSISPISFGTLARLCGGELHQGSLGEVSVGALCTDSREAGPGVVFVALHGERVDGHDYMDRAIEQGCRCIICEHSSAAIAESGATAIVVNDTELALSRLANAYQKQYLHCRNIAVTGSVGKTTTKDMIHSVLSQGRKSYCTPGNHNSTVGMPVAMLATPPESEWSVLEMGMSNFGEIERLSFAAEPEIAVITNIGSSHLETLGSRENICRAKLEVLCGLKKGGTLILNADEPLLNGISGKSYHTVYISQSCEKADFYAKNIKVEADCTRFDIIHGDLTYRDLCVRVPGKHNVNSALFAVAIGVIAGLSEEQIRSGLYNYTTAGMRQKISSMGDITVIEDCYNASPESMVAAIDVLAEYSRLTGRRSVAVLGDMLELGSDGPAMHRSVGAHLVKREVSLLFTVGKGGEQIAIGAMQQHMPVFRIFGNPDVQNVTCTVDQLLENLRSGDVVLFKASRAVGAERFIELLRRRMGSNR